MSFHKREPFWQILAGTEQKIPGRKTPLSSSWNVHNLPLLAGQTKVQLKSRQQPLLTYFFLLLIVSSYFSIFQQTSQIFPF